MAVSGVNSEGFRTTAFPVASAGPSFQDSMSTGGGELVFGTMESKKREYKGNSKE